MRTLYQGADIVTGKTTIAAGYLAVEDDRIASVGAERPAGNFDRVCDLSGKVICPGLVNAHTHIPMTILRGAGCGLALQPWLFDAIFPLEDKLDAGIVSAATRLGIAEMLRCGTTTFCDMYFFSDTIAQETIAAGMRANLARCINKLEDDGQPLRSYPSFCEARELYREYQGAGEGRIQVDFSLHSSETCAKQFITDVAAETAALGAHMQIHLSETRLENEKCLAKWGCTPAELMDGCGVFDSPTMAAHCVHLSESDLDLLVARGVSAVHCPSSNLKLGSGIAPIAHYLERGLNVALGTDGAASNNNLNMMEEMHLAAMLPKGASFDPTLIPSREALAIAAENGARAAGREEIGALQAGKKADFIALDFDAFHLRPCPDVLDHLVYSAQGADVCLTVVDGRALFENGRLLTIDEERLRHDVRRAEAKLFSK